MGPIARVVRGISAAIFFLLLACPRASGEGKVPQNFDEAWVLWRNTVDDVTHTKTSDPKACEALADRIKQAISQLEQFAKAESIKAQPGKAITLPLIDKLGKFVTPGLNAVLNQRPSQFSSPQDVYAFTNFVIGNLKYLLGKVTSNCPSAGQQAGTPGGPIEKPPEKKCITEEDIQQKEIELTLENGKLEELKGDLKKAQVRIGHIKESLKDASDPDIKADLEAELKEKELEVKRLLEIDITTQAGKVGDLTRDLEDLKERFKKQDCPKKEGGGGETPKKEAGGGGEPLKEQGGGGGGQIPKKEYPRRTVRRSFTENVTLITGTDNETWCTYGDGIEIYTPLTETDDKGTPIEVTEEAALEGEENESSGVPTTSEMPEVSNPTEEIPSSTKPAPEAPHMTEEQPQPSPEVPEASPTPEEPPATPIPDTIFVKAKEGVLQGQPTGTPIQNQVVKLFPPDKPELPGTGTKQAEDTGFNKDPVQCTTGSDGECKLQVPTEERALYGLPSKDEPPGKNYSRDYDLAKRSGGVAETTDEKAKTETAIPEGAEVTKEEFKVGARTFVRLEYQQAYDQKQAKIGEEFARVYGPRYEEDYCRDKQPGPPLGMQPNSFSALNHDLPEAQVTLPTQGGGP